MFWFIQEEEFINICDFSVPLVIYKEEESIFECWLLSHVRLFATSWTVASQALLSMGFSRQEHWTVLQFPSPGDLPDPEIELGSPALQADSSPAEL